MPPTPSAPKASRFGDVPVRPIDFPTFRKPQDPPSQLKGILRKTKKRGGAKKTVAFAEENRVYAHERWIGIWQVSLRRDSSFSTIPTDVTGRAPNQLTSFSPSVEVPSLVVVCTSTLIPNGLPDAYADGSKSRALRTPTPTTGVWVAAATMIVPDIFRA